MAIRLTTYEHAKDIPELPGTNVFHSTDLFRILEQTPGIVLCSWLLSKGINR